jgi:hypothetical protein
MKRYAFLAIGLAAMIFSAGCAPKPKMYDFGKYSQTLHSYEKNKTEKTLLNHKQELEKIVARSEKNNLPVPPGIYAELGYLNLKANKSEEAIKLFQTEAKLYPESEHLMNRLIQNAKAKEKPDSRI